MITKKITYVDYNGVERTETAYFNLTKTELAIMSNSVDGGVYNRLVRIVESKNTPEIMSVFCEILKKAYCIKSDDGRRLIKSDDLFEEFSQTPAYDQLFTEITGDETAMASFIKGILPSDLAKDLDVANINLPE